MYSLFHHNYYSHVFILLLHRNTINHRLTIPIPNPIINTVNAVYKMSYILFPLLLLYLCISHIFFYSHKPVVERFTLEDYHLFGLQGQPTFPSVTFKMRSSHCLNASEAFVYSFRPWAASALSFSLPSDALCVNTDLQRGEGRDVVKGKPIKTQATLSRFICAETVSLRCTVLDRSMPRTGTCYKRLTKSISMLDEAYFRNLQLFSIRRVFIDEWHAAARWSNLLTCEVMNSLMEY